MGWRILVVLDFLQEGSWVIALNNEGTIGQYRKKALEVICASG